MMKGYEFNDDPAPDLVEITPDGGMIVVAFQGVNSYHRETRRLGQLPRVWGGDALWRWGVNRRPDPRVPNLPS